MFGRARQSHDCVPGLGLEEYFATRPERERLIFDGVMNHVQMLGPVHADIVSVGIFLKNPRKFADLRPKHRWVAVSFPLEHRARHRLITRQVIEDANKFWHTANVESADDLDGDLLALLTEAYELVARLALIDGLVDSRPRRRS